MTNLQIPEKLADEIREEAEAEGVTVLDLLTQLLQEHRRNAKRRRVSQPLSDITERLNAIYATEDSSIDPALVKLQARALDNEKW